MRRTFILLAFAALIFTISAWGEGRTLHVGPGREFERIADAAAVVQPGDTVQIDSGVYHEAIRWRGGDLNGPPITIRGSGAALTIIDGTNVDIPGTGQLPRALFQVEGDNYIIEHLTLRNGRNGHNGAGIRLLNARRTIVRGCRILYNDMGMMSTANDELVVEHCEIAFNGAPQFNGYSHNFYLAGERALIQNCYIHDSTAGQNFKAYTRYIELFHNVIVDAHDRIDGGERTKEIGMQDGIGTDRPNSNAVLIGNLIVKRGDGSGFIDFGSEGEGFRNGTLYMIHNTVVREDSTNRWYLRIDGPAASAVLINNIFFGSNQVARGAGVGRITGSNNWFPHGTVVPEGLTDTILGDDPGFVNRVQRDYRLRPGAAAADRGVTDITYMDGDGQVQHPFFREPQPDLATVGRTFLSAPDLGTFEQFQAEVDGLAFHTLTGRVTDAHDRPIARTLILLRGARNATMMTDADGRYRFEQLPEGAYTVMPIDFELQYTPASRELQALANAGEVNFTTPPLYRITGRTEDLHGNGVPESYLFIHGSQFGWALTDDSGNYIFPRLVEGGSFKVTAARYNRSYQPDTQIVENIAGNAVVNFSGGGIFQVEGRVSDANGLPMPGITVTLSGAASRTTTSNVRGNFLFNNLAEGGSYTVAVVHENLTFSPAQVEIERLTGNETANFYGPGSFRIDGRVTDSAGNGIDNVRIDVSGTITRRVTTGVSGAYVIYGLPASGTYTLNITHPRFTFPDGSRTFSDLAADHVADFRALALFAVTGRVTDTSGNPVGGVSLAISGAQNRRTSTNGQGVYTFTNVEEATNITIQPTRSGFIFIPESQSFEAIALGQTANFTAHPLVTISGRIMDSNNQPVSGVTVTLSGPETRTARTNGAGTYTFQRLTPRQTYIVTPSGANWVFNPVSHMLDSVVTDQSADFSGHRQ